MASAVQLPNNEKLQEHAPLTDKNDLKALEENAQLVDGDEEKTGANRKNFDWKQYLKYVSLVVLVVQNTGQVLLMRYATRRDQQQFLKTVAVFYNEILKLVASTILFTISIGSVRKALRSFRHHFITDFLDTLKVSVPAFIYTIQNFLLYVAIDHLDAGTYMVTYQLKILTTALFTVLMLKRRLSVVQWLSLCVLIAGVALVQISAGKDAKGSSTTPLNSTGLITTTLMPTTTRDPDHSPPEQKPWIGLLAVLSACVMSGFAGIYFEKILKGSEVSIWLRNVQLASLSIPISLVVIAIKDRERVLKDGLMQGFDMTVWGVVALQALGGLVVAVVVKYADNILKAFATSIAIVVSSVASIFLFTLIPKPLFLGGAALVIGAVVLYSVFPYRAPLATTAAKDEEDEGECQKVETNDQPPPEDPLLNNNDEKEPNGKDGSLLAENGEAK